MQDIRGRMKSWARTRRGATAIVLATLLTAAMLSSDPRPAVAGTPFYFLMFLGIAWVGVWILARVWESKTWPVAPPFARTRSTSPQSRLLREDANARIFPDRGGFLFERRHFFVATGLRPVQLAPDFVQGAERIRHEQPVRIAADDVRTWWWYGDTFCWENCGHGPQDVKALLLTRARRRQRELEHAHMVMNSEDVPQQRRDAVTREMRRAVYERDGGACAECGSTFDLQYDHILPVALGGATLAENLQLLCSRCNHEKGARL